MEDERISLFDVSIQDNDVIAFGDVVYKVEKIRSIFKDLLLLIRVKRYIKKGENMLKID